MVWTYKRLAWLAGSWLCLGLGVGPLLAGAQTAAPKQAPPLPLRFGQPDPADLEAQGFVADSGTVAVVLYDVGQSRFASVAGHMAVVTERTTRIKILKKAGYAYATVEVPLYHQGENSKKLSNLRGFTYVRRADAVRPLVAQYPDPAARAAAVRQLVLNSVKYDGTNRYHATGPLRKAYELHRGTAADVNLLLVAALRQAELPAQPVILSTRAHGRASREYPLLEQFNYVVALLERPGQPDLLLDATEPLLPAGELPRRCLSRIGHTVAEKGEGRWVSLTPSRRYTHLQNIKLTLHAPGDLTGEVQEEYGGYAALEAREQVQQLGEKKYVAQLPAARAGWAVPAYSFSKLATMSQPLGLRYELHQSADAGSSQELYLKLLEPFGERRNPFRYAQRSYPVDIGMAQQEIVMLTLTLPPGYVADLPKSANLLLPEQGGRYLYQASAPSPNTVQLTSRLNLDKAVYSPDEYQALRELYQQLLAKQAEALVIRKTQ